MGAFRYDHYTRAEQETAHQRYKELMKSEVAFARDFPFAGNRNLRDALAIGCETVLVDIGISNDETCGRLLEGFAATQWDGIMATRQTNAAAWKKHSQIVWFLRRLWQTAIATA
eukprot:s7773_g1.t1